MATEDDFVARGPFNFVREFSAVMCTADDGTRYAQLRIRFGVCPGETSDEIALMIDDELLSRLGVRLRELDQREREPHQRH